MKARDSLDYSAAVLQARKIFMTLLLATDPLFEGGRTYCSEGSSYWGCLKDGHLLVLIYSIWEPNRQDSIYDGGKGGLSADLCVPR